MSKQKTQSKDTSMPNTQTEDPAKKWTKSEIETSKKVHGCELIKENCNEVELKNKRLPNDTYIITYEVDGTIYKDLVRGRRVKIFDMYWDKLGNCIKDIDWGYGTINPRIWEDMKDPPSKKK